MLLTRIFTGAILGILVITAIVFCDWYQFALATAILVAVCAFEWARLLGIKDELPLFSFVAGVILFMLLVSLLSSIYILILALVLWVGLAWLVYLYQQQQYPAWMSDKRVNIAIAAIVLAGMWNGLNALYQTEMGVEWVLFAFMLVWVSDTAAFFGGRRFGKHPLCDQVSPKKTKEGAATALCAGVILALIAAYFMSIRPMLWLPLICLVLLSQMAAIYGDLFESVLKREAGVKDSGTFLPGHGGFLDRFDALLAAVPLFALGGLFLIGCN